MAVKPKKSPNYKGLYKGPDVFKGNKKKIRAWKAAKKAKEDAAKKKAKDSKPKSLAAQAKDIAWGQYAGALNTIEGSKRFNETSYNTQKDRRQESLVDELASQRAAHSITRNTVSGLKGQALSQYVKDRATQQAVSSVRDAKTKATNSNLLSSYQQQMVARGLDPTQAEGMKANLSKSMGYTQELDRIRDDASVTGQQNVNMMYDRSLSRVDQQQNNAAANARASAQNDLNSAYDQYTSRQNELENTLASTKLDRGSSRVDIKMMLKKEKALAERESAQLKLEQYVAGLNNSQEMAKIASSDYFKQAELNLKKSDLNLKGKELSALIKDKKKKNQLAEASLLEKMRDNLRKNDTADVNAAIRKAKKTGKDPNYNPNIAPWDR